MRWRWWDDGWDGIGIGIGIGIGMGWDWDWDGMMVNIVSMWERIGDKSVAAERMQTKQKERREEKREERERGKRTSSNNTN